jgi:DNA-binding GntR family transcriptional regulator
MADELGTSDMPVREAFRRLEESGLLEKTPYKGVVVRGLTQDELLEIYGVRRLLEPEAARLAAASASHATVESVESMRQELTAMKDALAEHRVTDFVDHDEQLLTILYSGAGNRVLLDTIRAMWTRCRSYKVVGLQRAIDSAESAGLLVFQEALIQAVEAHDSEVAGQTIDASLRTATVRIQKRLRHHDFPDAIGAAWEEIEIAQ